MPNPTATTTYTVTGTGTVNLITNGDFSQGNTGFTSSYGVMPATGSSIGGDYGIGTTSIAYNTGWNPTTHDHTTGTGNFMIVDAATVANTILWQQTIAVQPNTTYNFSAWIGALYSANPATMRFSINGVQIGSTFTESTTISTWTQFNANWTSGSGVTNATITIIDDNLVASGNDFGLDDISFSTACINTAQVTVTVNPLPVPSITPTNITSCFGATTGAATLNVSSGSSPFTYLWNGGGYD